MRTTGQATCGWRLGPRSYVCGRALTPLHTDAKVVVDAIRNKRVSSEAKWVAPRYAMVRKAVEDHAVEIRKVDTRANRADLFTKPLVGPIFVEHRAAVLGLSAPSGDPSGRS